MTIKIGDYIRTPRFCTVRISALFATAEMMREAGFTEPTYFDGAAVICGKSEGENKMIFAAACAR